MSDPVRISIIVALLLVFGGGWILFQVWMFRWLKRKRTWHREHPDQFPSRRSRILRVLPLAVLVGVPAVVYTLREQWDIAVPAVIAVGCFLFLIARIASGREDLPGSG